MLPKPGAFSANDSTILAAADAMIGAAREHMKSQQLHQVLNTVWAVVADANRYFAGEAPWALAKDPQVSPLLSGLLLMGSTSDNGFFKSAAFKRRLPIYLGHGTRDIVIKWTSTEAFFKKFKAADPSYPIKLAIFNTGSHGTPIRMTDWRLILNWMLQVDGK